MVCVRAVKTKDIGILILKVDKIIIMVYFVVLEIYGNWAPKVGITRRLYRK